LKNTTSALRQYRPTGAGSSQLRGRLLEWVAKYKALISALVR
jgi:hypothetical protein